MFPTWVMPLQPIFRVRDNSSSSVIVLLWWTESRQTDRPHTKFTCSLVSSLAIYLHCSHPGNQHNIPWPFLPLYSPCDWLLTLPSGKPHLLRPDVDLGKSRYHLLSRDVMTCAQTHVSRVRWMEVGAERQNACDSEGPNQREIAAVQAKLQRCLETYQRVVLPPCAH